MSDAIDKTWQAIDEDVHREEATSTLHLGRSGPKATAVCIQAGQRHQQAVLYTAYVVAQGQDGIRKIVLGTVLLWHCCFVRAISVDDAVCRAEAPTLRMDSGRLSITIPIREGVPADLVKNEVLKQMKRLSQAGAGRFFVHVSSGVPSGLLWHLVPFGGQLLYPEGHSAITLHHLYKGLGHDQASPHQTACALVTARATPCRTGVLSAAYDRIALVNIS